MFNTYFFIKDVHSSCALWDVTLEEGKEIQDYLNTHEYNLYDKIIQIADHLGDASGFVTIERRLMDVHLRKRINENTINTWKAIFRLQLEIEELLGCSIYQYFPEIQEGISKTLIKDFLTLD